MNALIEQMSAQIGVLNALIEEMRWRNGRIAKAIARAKAAERGEEKSDEGCRKAVPKTVCFLHPERVA